MIICISIAPTKLKRTMLTGKYIKPLSQGFSAIRKILICLIVFSEL